MLDPKLKSINQYTSKDYIENVLKTKFNEVFWQRYGITRPADRPLVDEYFIEFDDYIPQKDGKYKVRSLKLKHTFKNYFINYIKNDFEKLIIDFYDEVKFIAELDKIDNYGATILSQLDQIKTEMIKNGIDQRIVAHFDNGVNKFQKEFLIDVKKPNSKTKKSGYSFYYKEIDNSPHNINFIFYDLRSLGYISENTTLSQFKSVFLNNSKISHRITWTGSATAFSYFIKCMTSHKDFLPLKQSKWKVASKCFYVTNNKGEELTPLRMRDQKRPTKEVMESIEKIMNI